jgi:hypothetical protein
MMPGVFAEVGSGRRKEGEQRDGDAQCTVRCAKTPVSDSAPALTHSASH